MYSVKHVHLASKQRFPVGHVHLINHQNRKPTETEANENCARGFGHFHFLHVDGQLVVVCIRLRIRAVGRANSYCKELAAALIARARQQ